MIKSQADRIEALIGELRREIFRIDPVVPGNETKTPPTGWTTSHHFESASAWPASRAMVVLAWACENGATVPEMNAYYKALYGDL